MFKIDLTGQQFERLKVIKFSHQDKSFRSYWLCQCSCGRTHTIQGFKLTSKDTRSCGCLRAELNGTFNYKHGYGGDTGGLYRVWCGMRQRCSNPNNHAYKYYGGRGISVSSEWLEFITFKEWSLKNGYAKGLQVDRIDNDSGYCPKNCRWVTQTKNGCNKSNNLKYKGECASEAGIRINGNANLVRLRVHRGWSLKRAFTTPAFNRGKMKKGG